MNLHNIIIDRSAEQKKLRIKLLEDELHSLGYFRVPYKGYLAEVIAQARRQGSLEHAR